MMIGLLPSPRCLAVPAALAALALLAGCGEDNRYVAPPPPVVTVMTPVQKTVTLYLEATGNTAAVNTANLVARVPGFVQEIKYQDGDFVKKGTPLFIIEPEPYKLKLDQAKAAEDGGEGRAHLGRSRIQAAGRPDSRSRSRPRRSTTSG